MTPGFAIANHADVRRRDAESLTDTRRRNTIGKQPADMAHVVIGELCSPTLLADLSCSVFVFSGDVRLLRFPYEIRKSVVGADAVQMRGSEAIGTQANECFEHQSMHGSRCSAIVADKPHTMIAVTIKHGRNVSGFRSEIPTAPTALPVVAHLPVIRNLVTFKPNDASPFHASHVNSGPGKSQ